MLSKIIRERLENKFGKEIRYSKDCEVFADEISEKTMKKISPSAIKRIFGLAKGTMEPRLYTMDVISIYLDYKNYDELLKELQHTILPEKEIIEQIRVEELNLNDELIVFTEPSINLKLNYLGDCKFKGTEEVNSELRQNDIVLVNHILRDYPLFIKNVIRNGKHLGPLTAFKMAGVNSIRIN
jgi:hypothetical protein